MERRYVECGFEDHLSFYLVQGLGEHISNDLPLFNFLCLDDQPIIIGDGDDR